MLWYRDGTGTHRYLINITHLKVKSVRNCSALLKKMTKMENVLHQHACISA